MANKKCGVRNKRVPRRDAGFEPNRSSSARIIELLSGRRLNQITVKAFATNGFGALSKPKRSGCTIRKCLDTDEIPRAWNRWSFTAQLSSL